MKSVRFHSALFVALLCIALVSELQAQSSPASAGQQSPSVPAKPQTEETVVVLGTAAPVPLAESTRAVEVLGLEQQWMLSPAASDALGASSSVYLEQRGSAGGPADLVLRGGGFQQTLVLLNGLRINDSQTGHHNLDLPVPLDAMREIEVLPGAGSALYGADAMSGVVDFLTAAPARDELRLRLGGGSFSSMETAFEAGLARGGRSARFTGSRLSSDGFMTDRDYDNRDASLEGWLGSRLGVTDLMLAASDRAYGANQFYGSYSSWERTKGWFASARQELGPRTSAAFGYRRHADDFILIRGNPALYENNHIDHSWQAAVRRTEPVAKDSVLLAGLEADGDSIHSNNLGEHARNRGAGYIDLDLRPSAHRWSLSAGLRGEIFSGGRKVLSPQLAASLRLGAGWKLRSSGGYGFRIPTYTDLYYSDPSTVGDAKLKPESAWEGEGGVEWARSRRLLVSVTGFYTREHDAIDYVRTSASEKWQATNLSGMRYVGMESRVEWQPARGERVRLSWTALSGAQDSLHGMLSRYVYNYPRHNAVAEWSAALPGRVTMTHSVRGVERYGHGPYAAWDAAVARDAGRWRPYLRLTNAANTGYEQIDGVRMPGRAVSGGVMLQFGR